MTKGFRALLLAGATLASLPALAAPITVTVDPLGAPPYSLVPADDLIPDSYASSGPVTFDWNPNNNGDFGLRYWWGEYSGNNAAAFCLAGTTVADGGPGAACLLDLRVASGNTVTLSSFFLGSYLSADRTVEYSVFDLTDDTPVAVGTPTVGAAGVTVTVSATSSTGFRIAFGPDGYNGGINNIVYSTTEVAPPSAVPAPPALALFGVGLLGLGLVGRRRQAG